MKKIIIGMVLCALPILATQADQLTQSGNVFSVYIGISKAELEKHFGYKPGNKISFKNLDKVTVERLYSGDQYSTGSNFGEKDDYQLYDLGSGYSIVSINKSLGKSKSTADSTSISFEFNGKKISGTCNLPPSLYLKKGNITFYVKGLTASAGGYTFSHCRVSFVRDR